MVLQLVFIGILMLPLLAFGSYRIPLSYVILIVLLWYLIIDRRHLKIFFPKEVSLIFLTIFLILSIEIFSTLLSVVFKGASVVLWATFIGILKNLSLFLFITIISYESFQQKNEFNREQIIMTMIPIFQIVMSANLIAIAVQFFWPEIGIKLVMSYSSESKITLRYLQEYTSLSRLYGLNYSPVLLGAKSLFCFTSSLFGLIQWTDSRIRRKLWVILLLSLLNGIFSLSKTFILGSLVSIFAFILLLFIANLRTHQIRISPIIFLILFLIFFILIVTNSETLTLVTGLPFSYYFSYVTNPLDAFLTRYSQDFVSPDAKFLYEVIHENPILGVGYISLSEEFIGDSEYLVAMHNGGLISLVLRISLMLILMYIALKSRDNFLLGIIFASLIAGLGQPVLFSEMFLILIGGYIGYYAQRKLFEAKSLSERD